jgi:hypothetical protein
LEFLGDAILEIIVVAELMAYEGELSHSLMHLYKTTLVNGDYLSFLALEWKIAQKQTDITGRPKVGLRFTEVESLFSLPLWRFMRHGDCPASARHSARWSVDMHLLRCEILQESRKRHGIPLGFAGDRYMRTNSTLTW